ncbi:hypothetical protein BKA64DRAFT_728062 [Cadophora sp. MPI-SDFR-AT-0126]|nr:hypothetical protein BKA64DRAFT_728062 [Leotiomycetes sp. MPI-SDFR-AT-0126]
MLEQDPTVIENEALGVQCNEQELSTYSLELKKIFQPHPLTALPRFQLVEVATLTDWFPNHGYKPKGKSLARWMQVICQGLHDVVADQMTDEVVHQIESYLPWVNSRISSLVTKGAGGRHSIVSRLIWFLMKSIQAPQFYQNYMWVRVRSRVWLFESRLEFRLDGRDVLLARPKECTEKIPWFAVDEEEMGTFLEAHYTEELEDTLVKAMVNDFVDVKEERISLGF